MKNSEERERFIWRHLLTGTMTQEHAIRLIADAWTAEIAEAKNAGYTEAAEDITQVLRDCIPDRAVTVHQAQIQGAWRDAAQVAYNHLGKQPAP